MLFSTVVEAAAAAHILISLLFKLHFTDGSRGATPTGQKHVTYSCIFHIVLALNRMESCQYYRVCDVLEYYCEIYSYTCIWQSGAIKFYAGQINCTHRTYQSYIYSNIWVLVIHCNPTPISINVTRCFLCRLKILYEYALSVQYIFLLCTWCSSD